MGNPNDFSWRNRVATWPGTLEVMARKPLTGWGWNSPVAVYEHGHQPVWLSEVWAITLNDYFMLGMTLGVPALWAFLLWIWLAWQPATVDIPSQLSTCLLPYAALLPLLLGFALEGGLFKVAVAVPFCVLTNHPEPFPLPAGRCAGKPAKIGLKSACFAICSFLKCLQIQPKLDFCVQLSLSLVLDRG